MKAISSKKWIVAALCMTASANALFVQSARAYVPTCRDYYSAYVYQASESSPPPSSTTIIVYQPHFHDHYPEYHGGHGHEEHGGGGHHGGGSDEGDDSAAIIVGVGLALSVTTTLAEDAKLSDAKDMISIVDEAQMGDGANLRSFVAQVQADTKSSVTQAQVAAAVIKDNKNLSFCPAGDLSSVSELAQKIASELSPAS